MKICSKCHQAKELSEFYVRNKGKRAGETYNHCKSCLKTRGKLYYTKNLDRQRMLSVNRNRIHRKTQREFVSALKSGPCIDCGKRFPPYVMDFDHRNEDNKHGNIGTLVSQSYYTIEKLMDEIKKCDLVCANCHRIRTYQRNHPSIA